MKKNQCPCCEFYTFDPDYTLFEICEVCLWQYDEVAHDEPDTMLGANKVTLNQAKENYKKIGVKEERLLGGGRKPEPDEFPENNE
ncbi:MAG: hypothetical protein FWH04_00105 [Oscillospiraceae bacterium]|nr:hypothetical protein [Oscillospiraceae bacterium]